MAIRWALGGGERAAAGCSGRRQAVAAVAGSGWRWLALAGVGWRRLALAGFRQAGAFSRHARACWAFSGRSPGAQRARPAGGRRAASEAGAGLGQTRAGRLHHPRTSYKMKSDAEHQSTRAPEHQHQAPAPASGRRPRGASHRDVRQCSCAERTGRGRCCTAGADALPGRQGR